MGKSRTAALKEAGLSGDTFTHPPENGRRVDVFERLMPVLGWEPRTVLDLIARCFEWPINTELLLPSAVHIELRNVDVRIVSSSLGFSEAGARRLESR